MAPELPVDGSAGGARRPVPSVGRIVQYAVTETDVERINSRRNDAVISSSAAERTGFIVHVGNQPVAGQVFPLVITAVWDGTGEVNGQVLLDGNDTLWVTSLIEGDLPGQWRWPERV